MTVSALQLGDCARLARDCVQFENGRLVVLRLEGQAEPVTHATKRSEVGLLRPPRLLVEPELPQDQPQQLDVVEVLGRVVEDVPGIGQGDRQGNRISFARKDHWTFLRNQSNFVSPLTSFTTDDSRPPRTRPSAGRAERRRLRSLGRRAPAEDRALAGRIHPLHSQPRGRGGRGDLRGHPSLLRDRPLRLAVRPERRQLQRRVPPGEPRASLRDGQVRARSLHPRRRRRTHLHRHRLRRDDRNPHDRSRLRLDRRLPRGGRGRRVDAPPRRVLRPPLPPVRHHHDADPEPERRGHVLDDGRGAHHR